jgi:hypothetical protein
VCGTKLESLGDHGVDRRPHGKRNNAIVIGFGANDVERLRADGAGGPGDRDCDALV